MAEATGRRPISTTWSRYLNKLARDEGVQAFLKFVLDALRHRDCTFLFELADMLDPDVKTAISVEWIVPSSSAHRRRLRRISDAQAVRNLIDHAGWRRSKDAGRRRLLNRLARDQGKLAFLAFVLGALRRRDPAFLPELADMLDPDVKTAISVKWIVPSSSAHRRRLRRISDAHTVQDLVDQAGGKRGGQKGAIGKVAGTRNDATIKKRYQRTRVTMAEADLLLPKELAGLEQFRKDDEAEKGAAEDKSVT